MYTAAGRETECGSGEREQVIGEKYTCWIEGEVDREAGKIGSLGPWDIFTAL